MDGLRIIFILVAVGIVLINFIINLGNISKLVSYCFATNTLDKYWPNFFEHMVSGRAIISSIIGFVVALIIFLLITPFILFRQAVFKKKVLETLSDGRFFEYKDIDIKESENNGFYTNLDEAGLNKNEYSITGKLRIDAITAIASISKQCEEKKINFSYDVMKEIKLNNSKKAVVPLLLKIEEQIYPTYFLYNQEHKNQFKTIRSSLYDSGFKKSLYFSKDGIVL